MDNKNDVMLDLTLPEGSGGSLVGVYLKLILAPVLFFALFLLGYLGVLNFKVELHSIVMMGFLLFIALIFARHNAEYGCRLFEDKIDSFKLKLKEYIMSHLLIIGNRKKSNADFTDFSDDFVRNLRNENYSNIAFGIFPMLGILGTFISIAISMPNFSSKNINALESEIAQLLGGVGTAFYVSIYGIFLALWWIYFEKRGLSRFEKLVFKYKNATKNFFWQNEEITQGLLQEIASKNDKTVAILQEIFSGDYKLEKALKDKLNSFEELVELEERAVKLSSNQLQKVYEIVNDTTKIQTELSRNFDSVANSIQNLEKNIVSIQSALTKEYKDIMDSTAQKGQMLENSFAKFENSLTDFKSSIKSMNDESILELKNARANFKDGIYEGIEDFKKEFYNQDVEISEDSGLLEELKESLKSIEKDRKDLNNKND